MATSSPCNTVRALRNETTETVQQIERELGCELGCDLEALMPHIAGRVGRGTYETGDTRLGALSVGQSDAFADRIEPLATIVRRIKGEAEASLARLGTLNLRHGAIAAY